MAQRVNVEYIQYYTQGSAARRIMPVSIRSRKSIIRSRAESAMSAWNASMKTAVQHGAIRFIWMRNRLSQRVEI